MTRRRTAVVLLLGAVAALVAGVVAYRARTPEPATTGPHPAADLFYRQTFGDADGTMRSMADLRGKVVLVNFWATWCVPCVQEIPAFSTASSGVAGRVAFVGLGIDSPSNIAAFAARVKPSYPLVAAGAVGTDLARALGNPSGALPFTVLLDADGRMIESHLGRVDDAMLERWLAPYRGGPPAVTKATTPT